MWEENSAIAANCSEPIRPPGGTLDWKDTSALTASHQCPILGGGGWGITEGGNGEALEII